LVLIAGGTLTAQAQTAQPTGIPGPNINIIGPTPYPPGVTPVPGVPSPLIEDLQLKQKNEPQCAVRPDEPRHIFCIYNDYRGVDTPTIGDSWIGASMSRDEGLTWLSRLVPGFPNDTLHPSLNLGFAADPMIAAMPGLAVVGFLAANRDGNQPGGLFLQRWVELNKEDGFPWAYSDTKPVSSGTAGQFRDKPAMLATLAPPGTTPLSLSFVVDGQSTTRQVPAGTLHVAYANFTGNDGKDSSQIQYLQSRDYGATWSSQKKLSESVALNQGVSIAADPTGQNLVIVWRQFDFNSNQPHSIVFSRSTDFGATWSKVKTLGANFICPFDQDVGDLQFRSKALPVIVHDGKQFLVFWAQRTGTGSAACVQGQSRIFYVASDTGVTWGTPTQLDTSLPATAGGHQFMPAATAAGGVVQVVWYDNRYDEFYDGGIAQRDVSITDAVDPPSNINRRHTADLFQVQIKRLPTGLQVQVPVRVSQYAKGTFEGRLDQQLERNYVNARIFRQGTAPFIGDYISAAAPAFRLNSDGQWISNISAPLSTDRAPAEPTFQVAWADNRHIRSNVYLNPGQATSYTPPIYNMQGEPGDPTTSAKCGDPSVDPTTGVPVAGDPLKALARNQRILSSLIKPGVLLTAATPTKRGSESIQRAHVVQLQNLRDPDQSASVTNQEIGRFQLKLSLPPSSSGGSASFLQFGSTNIIDVLIPEGSSAARTVFVTPPSGSLVPPTVVVDVFECTNGDLTKSCGASASTASLALNGNPTAGDILDPDCASGSSGNSTCYPVGSGSVQITEVHDPDLAAFVCPLDQPDCQYPSSIQNPSYRNPSLRNPSLRNQTYESPSLRNESVQSPSLRNPSLRNTALTDADMVDPNVTADDWYTDFVYTIENEGNTTTGYNLKPLITGDDASQLKTQLIVSNVYHEPTSFECNYSSLETQQVVVNIVNPYVTDTTLSDPGVDPDPKVATFLVEPGGSRQVTLRVWGVDPRTPAGEAFGRRVAMKVYSQAKNTDQTLPTDEVPNDVLGTIDTVDPVFAGCTPTSGSPCPLAGPFEADSPSGWNVQYDAKPQAIDCAPDPTNPSGPQQCTSISPDLVTCAPASGSGVVIPVGQGEIVCAAIDLGGNKSAETAFVFTVQDTTPPAIATITDVTAEATSAAGAVVTYTAPTATDTASTTTTVTCSPTSGSAFPLGATTVTCTATDTATPANTATSTFKVTVVDTTPPAIATMTDVTASATNAAGAVVTYASPTVTDNVGATVTCAPASGSTFPLGMNTVTCTARDAAGNTATSTFKVTVVDTTPPVMPTLTNVAAQTQGTNDAVVNYTVGKATDLVSGSITLVCKPASGSTFAIGSTTVNCTATDGSGNTSSGIFTVTVKFGYYGIEGVFANGAKNINSSVPLDFGFTKYVSATSTPRVDSSLAQPVVSATYLGAKCNTFTNPTLTYAGQSDYRYSASSLNWQFNWKTTGLTAGCYKITVTSNYTGQPFASKYTVTLTK
jgi:hypothetical protein